MTTGSLSGFGAEPLVRLSVGKAVDFVVVSPPIEFGEHWLSGRNQICCGPGCPACELWDAKQRVLRLCVRLGLPAGGHQIVAVTLPAVSGFAGVELGRLVTVTRTSRGYKLEPGRQVDAPSFAWLRPACVVARLFAVPLPEGSTEEDVYQWWASTRRRARRRLELECGILSAGDRTEKG